MSWGAARKATARVHRTSLYLAALTAGLTLSTTAAAAQPTSPQALRYDLRAGDRLVYRETLRRESTSERGSSTIEVAWTSEVLVLGSGREGAAVGLQRRRLAAELVRASENGKDTLARERASFAQQAARRHPEVLAEANVFDAQGQARFDVQARREWTSELLPFVHEIVALPSAPLAPGDTWSGGTGLGLSWRAEAWEDVGAEPCLRLHGERASQITLRAWFCPGLGALRRVELAGHYFTGGRELREHLSFELRERARAEALSDWLASPTTRRGALAALLLADGLVVDTAQLEPLLRVDDDALRLDALALLWRRRASVAPPALLPLLASPSARVRTLAVRLLDDAAAEPARAAVTAALDDGDAFVRAAARRWLRRRVPASDAPAPRRADVAEDAWPALAATPSDERAAVETLGDDVRAGPDWRCDEAHDRATSALAGQRFAPEPPGVWLRIGQTGAARGQPYVVRVPEDYRGDEPVPLLVYLSGGPGRTLVGWSTAARALSATGYLAVFPQASGMWWDVGSERVVAALLDEVIERYHVDTNRVYVAGFSNGGTGALRYAALWPDRLAAAVSLMGAGMFVEGAAPAPLGGVGRLPLLFVHGERDSVIPARASTDTVAELQREVRGARVELRLLPGRDHDLTLDDDEGLTLRFLERFAREPFPREVAFSLADLRAPRRYWVEVLEKDAGTARVEARIDARGVIDVKTRHVRRLRLLLRRELLPDAGELRVRVDGRDAWRGMPHHDCALLQRTWHDTHDPFRAWSLEIPLEGGRR